MAESDPPTPEPAPEPTKAQAEFHSYKDRLQQPGAAAPGPAASFASPLPSAAIPAWSLRPAPVGPYGPPGPGPGPGAGGYGPPALPGGGGYTAIVDGVGNTIRLGVEVLNAALSSSLQMINGYAGSWGSGACDCEECNPCGGYDCCSVMGSGCGCCEPSVGSCC